MKNKNQIAAEAEAEILRCEPWTGPSEETRKIRRNIIQAAIDKAYDEGWNLGRTEEHDAQVARAAHASEPNPLDKETSGFPADNMDY